MLKKLFPILVVVAAAMFAYAPFMILAAPYESTMGLVQKIFYFHAACGMAMFLTAFVSGVGSAAYLFTRKLWADRLAVSGAELTVIIGLLVLVTGPLWAHKAWGVWWTWDGMANVPFVYWSVNVWRTLHPKTSVIPTLQAGMRGTFWFCVAAFLLLSVVILMLRTELEKRKQELDALYLAAED
jgi:ABC-type transport system involved in cytochrome c biogenesis permease subunit